MAKARGLYKRAGSPLWYMDYTDSSGRRIRESSKTADREVAQRILDDKRGRVARGEVLCSRRTASRSTKRGRTSSSTTRPRRGATCRS